MQCISSLRNPKKYTMASDDHVLSNSVALHGRACFHSASPPPRLWISLAGICLGEPIWDVDTV